ncbi:DUF1275 domain protein [Xylariaceae sp. FL0255]|nr:DUF1275 domain protein [Xylariaceae sp. FL0255]
MPDEESTVPSPTSQGSLKQAEKPIKKFSRSLTKDALDDGIARPWIPLLVACFATGFTDGTVFRAYSTFVSMQTGNTVFIALGASDQNTIPYAWVRSILSISSFIVGCGTFSRALPLLVSGRQRPSAVLSFLVQTILVIIAAALTQGGLIKAQTTAENSATDFTDLAPITLLSFQAAGQIVNSRVLGVSEVPSVVVTTLLCDLVSDPKLLAPLGENPKRNKRATAFTLILLGAIVGGFVYKTTGGVQYSLWVVGGLKALTTLYCVFAVAGKGQP